MRDGNAGTPTLGRVLLVAAVLAVLVLSVGCVTIHDCGAGIKSRLLLAECAWACSSSVC